jgi:DNA-binding transcriptional regulator YiaG
VEEIEKRLRVQGEVLAGTREEAESARGRSMELAIEAAAAGLSQHRIAELLGVDRMTVRKWVGKR